MIMCKVWDILSQLAIIEKSGWIQVYRVSSLISLSQFTRAPRVQYLGTIYKPPKKICFGGPRFLLAPIKTLSGRLREGKPNLKLSAPEIVWLLLGLVTAKLFWQQILLLPATNTFMAVWNVHWGGCRLLPPSRNESWIHRRAQALKGSLTQNRNSKIQSRVPWNVWK